VAPSLSTNCSANPASGPAPLTVSFSLNVVGAQGGLGVRINYGDGAAGTEISAPHTYGDAGSYTASFNVSTPTQSALCSATVRVDAAPAPTPSPTPAPGAVNQAPSAVFNTNPDPDSSDVFVGVPTLTIAFNMCRSTDPDGDPLNFRMDLDGDGVFEVDGPTGADCRRSHDYDRFGIFVARVCVTDLLPSRSPAHPYQCRNYVVRLDP
jgi:PKD repeat protein